MCEPLPAARKQSPWRAIPLQVARAFGLQIGASGATTVCTLVGIANHIQVGVEMGPRGLCPLQKGWYKLAVALLSSYSGRSCLPESSRALQREPLLS